MFKHRSYTKELLDGEDGSDQELIQNLKELDTINSILGGYTISLDALKKIIRKDKTYKLVDIGCGGGDTLKHIQKWALKNNRHLQLFGIDLKPVCIDYCKTNNRENPGIRFICDDYRNAARYVPDADILHACLFCHHLTELEIIELIRFARKNHMTLVINDLERNAIAWFFISILTRMFSKSYYVKNDAPLSVLRGFKKKEWKAILKDAGAHTYSLENKWAFRHELIIYNASCD